MLQDKTRLDSAMTELPIPVDELKRIAELEREVAQLREALTTRQRYGVVTGALAVRFGMTPDRTWQLLVRLSQHTNTKMQVVAGVVHDIYFGQLAPTDRALADRLNAELSGRLMP